MELLSKFAVDEGQLQQLHLPTLVIAGQADLLLPSVTEAEYLAKQLPTAEMLVLADSGHACLLEKTMESSYHFASVSHVFIQSCPCLLAQN
jgi:pimeloyl-ACP methyl ester carboxylesterase